MEGGSYSYLIERIGLTNNGTRKGTFKGRSPRKGSQAGHIHKIYSFQSWVIYRARRESPISILRRQIPFLSVRKGVVDLNRAGVESCLITFLCYEIGGFERRTV